MRASARCRSVRSPCTPIKAGGNAADIDAHYELGELKILFPAAGITVGREVLSGERGTFDATTNPAFQTPLATLHPFQG
jgi:hypothetical protein